MLLHNFSHAKELMRVAKNMDIQINILTENEAREYISFILDKYNPWKTEGHLSISDDAGKLSTDDKEFSFPLSMKNVPAFIFFEQNYINKNNVIVVERAQEISMLMKNSHGMEYFISDKHGTYLIAVNWYSIEFIGDIVLN